MKYIPSGTHVLLLVGLSSIQLFFQCRPPSTISSSAAWSFRPSRILLSANYRAESGRLDGRSPIRRTQGSIRISHWLGLVPCLFLMLMDWAMSHMRPLSLLAFCCFVMLPFSCQIPNVSAAHSLTPTLAFSAQTQTGRVGIWIVFASATSGFGSQKASHYILCSQRCSMIDWWISNACSSKQWLGVLNILSQEWRCGSSREESVSKVLDIVSKVGREGKYIYGLGGVVLIRQHHLGCNSARKPFPLHHLSALIHRLNA